MPQPKSPYRSIAFDRRRFGRPKALQFPYLVELAMRPAWRVQWINASSGLWRELKKLPAFRADGAALPTRPTYGSGHEHQDIAHHADRQLNI